MRLLGGRAQAESNASWTARETSVSRGQGAGTRAVEQNME
jgi:hypothetical protein